MMESFIKLGLDLEAKDNASPTLKRVMDVFEKLHKTLEDTAKDLATSRNLEIPIESFEKTVNRANLNVAKSFDKMGDHASGVMARMLVDIDRYFQRQEVLSQQALVREANAARARANASIAETNRMLQAEANAARRRADASIAETNRMLQVEAVAARRRADASIAATEREIAAEKKSRGETAFLVEKANQDINASNQKRAEQAQRQLEAEANAARKAADASIAATDRWLKSEAMAARTRADKAIAETQRMVAAEKKARGESAWIAEQANQRITDSNRKRAEQEARFASQSDAQSARRGGGGLISALGGMGGGMGGGGRGITGGLMSASQGALGFLGSAAQGLASFGRGGFSLLPDTLSRITDGFGRATTGMGSFVRQGLMIAGVYQGMQLLENVVQGLGQSFVQFDTNMARIQALTIQGKKNVDSYREAAIRSSMETGRPAVETAEALMYIESHGLSGNAAELALRNATRMSASGLGSTPDLIRTITGQAAEYNIDSKSEKGLKQIQRLFDVYTRVEQASVVPPGELAGQYQRATPLAAGLSVGPEQLGAFVSTVSQSGLGGGRIMTDTIAVMQAFNDMTPKAQDALEKYGLTADDVRKVLSDPSPEGGLFGAVNLIAKAFEGDPEAAMDFFGDGQRAAVGFFSAVKNGGSNYAANLKVMEESTGAVDQVWERMSQTVGVQLPRIGAIIQGAFNTIFNEAGGSVGTWLKSVNDAFEQGDITSGLAHLGEGFTTVMNGITSTLADMAGKMFGSGGNLIIELANGMIDAASSVLAAAAEFAADVIASFLIGHSGTARGPLTTAAIQRGVSNWNQEYAKAQLTAGMALSQAAERVAGSVNEQMAKIGGTGAAGTKEGVQKQIAELDKLILPWKMAADQVKESYEALLHPLERQMEMIRNIKDMEYERSKLKFEERDLDIMKLEMRAEGDPAKRAALAGRAARQSEINAAHSIDRQLAALDRRSRETGKSKMTPRERSLEMQEIADSRAMLQIQKEQHALVNPALMGQVATAKQRLAVDKQIAEVAHRTFELNKAQALLPLQQEHDKLKAAMQAELDYIKQQTDGYEDQKKVLQSILSMMNADAAGARAAAGARGGGVPIPRPPVAVRENPVTADTITANFRKQLEVGMNNYMNSPGFKALGAGLAGGLMGFMVAGLPGAVAGAAFGPKLMEALSARGITDAHLKQFVENFSASLRDMFARVGLKLSARDLLGTVGEIKVSLKEWVDGFEKAFFAEWTVASETQGALGNELTFTRFAGVGRQIVEAITGSISDAPLNFGDLQAAFSTLLKRVYEGMTGPTFREGDMGGLVVGPSPVEQIFTAGLAGGSFVLGIVGAAADALADAFTKLGSDERVKKGANDLGKTIGIWLMGGTPEGFESDEGVKAFIDGLKKLDRAILEAGKSLAKELMAGFWEGVQAEFSLDKMSTFIKPGSFLDLVVNGPGALVRGPGALNEDGTPRTPHTPVTAAPALATHLGLSGSQDTSPLKAVPGVSMDDSAALGADLGQGILAGFRDAWASDSDFKEVNRSFWENNVVGTAHEVFQMSQPSRTFHEIGEGVLAGFAGAISDDATVGATVRMFLRSEVIAQAQSILLIGEGKSGGLPGVAKTALDAFADVFKSPPPGLADGLDILGRSVVTGIMAPIKDPSTGIIAQVRDIINAIPKTPTPTRRAPADDEGGAGGGGGNNWGGPNVMAATGADFLVGGSGGTDSEHLNLWATPGERVRVGSGSGAGSTRNISNTFNINVSGGDPTAVRDAVAAGIQEGLGDSEGDVPNQLLNAWRTAKAQGAARPIGTQARGSRG